jgi:hypothetical protein
MENQNLKKVKGRRFLKNLIEAVSYLLAAVSVLFIILLFYGNNFAVNLIVAIVAALIFVALRAALKSYFDKQQKQNNSLYRFFFSGLKVIIVILLLIGILGVYSILTNSTCGPCAVYQAIGLGIIVIWACVFLAYFIWAIYYYNINLGLTEEEWDKIKEAKDKKARGENYSVDDLNVERKDNPYKEETFGLPGGTVRGMIAFTLLFGAIAMLIVSIGMENEIDTNAMFWDQYEFFKTAFLMMIAFYFGSRSLQYLQNRNNKPDGGAGKTDVDHKQPPVVNIDNIQVDPTEIFPGTDPMDATGKTPETGSNNNNQGKDQGTNLFDPMKP